MLENYRHELARRGVSASVVVEAGDPRELLCAVAEREHPDLMMIGHRTTGLRHLAQLGSVTVHCIEHAPTSVFIVRV
jgi:nucleotide-binding universal stress UspA family protein